MKGLLFEAIEAEVKEKLKEVKYIEIDIGQVELDLNIDRKVFQVPAILVGFDTINWVDKSKFVQEGEAQVSISVVSKSVKKSPYDFDFVDKVFLALQNFEGKFFSPFTRIAEAKTIYTEVYIISTIIFETIITDSRVLEAYEQRLKKVSVDIDVQKPTFKKP